MRVLHFYKTSFPDTMGGSEQVIHQIATGAGRHGVRTDVLSLTPDRSAPTTEMPGYTVYRAPLDFQIASTFFSWSAFSRFSRLVKNYDVVHYHFPWPFMDLVHFATRHGKPSIVSYHSDIVKQKRLLQLYRPLMHRFLGSVDRIVSEAPPYAESSEVLRRFRHKVKIIPIGLDKATYPQPDPERLAHWRARLGNRFFLFIGVLRYYKGLHFLVEAMKGAGYPVAIVGAGPEEAALKEQARREGVDQVHFLGKLSNEDKSALLTLCQGLVFPSHLRSEAFGISLLEGAMYGKPMISCEIGTGTTYINQADVTGLVVPPADPAALRRAMDRLWHEPGLAARMGAAAEQRYWELFTAERMVQSYVDLYREVAGAARPA